MKKTNEPNIQAIWTFEKQQIVTQKVAIYGLMANYLVYNNAFRSIRPDKKGVCELCDKRFADNAPMHLALNSESGNLFLCDVCKDEAIANGVRCNV